MRGPKSRHVRWLTLALAGLLAFGGVACDSSDDGGTDQPAGGDQEQPEGDGGY